MDRTDCEGAKGAVTGVTGGGISANTGCEAEGGFAVASSMAWPDLDQPRAPESAAV